MWKIINKDIDIEKLLVNESIFTQGNGYLGVRGNFEEGYDKEIDSIRGVYLNGVYAVIDIEYPEGAFGYPDKKDKQPRLMDCQTIEIYLDGEMVNLFNNSYKDFTQSLDMKEGIGERSFIYKTKSSKEAKINFKRMVSFKNPELFIQEVSVEYDGIIKIKSILDGDVENFVDPSDSRVGAGDGKLISINKSKAEIGNMYMEATILNSNIKVGCRVFQELEGDNIERNWENSSLKIVENVISNNKLSIKKYNIFSDSLRIDNVEKHTKEKLDSFIKLGFHKIITEQKEYLDKFWNDSDIEINSSDKTQEQVRFAIFQLIQSVGKDKFSNISAKGLSGEGYEGHYFWDTEVYMIPYYLISKPEIVKSLLLFRYNQLDWARKEAKNLSATRGAKFPWRSISGRECSPYFPAGPAQYHINSDIAYGFIKYFLMTEDLMFMKKYGIEVLLETSLFYLEVGNFSKGYFKIDGVTGPDEYTAMVNNNYYTNVMAKMNFRWALKSLDLMEEKEKDELLKRLSISNKDLELMDKAEKNMFLPYDEKLKINAQDDSFLSLKEWDYENTKHPLLLHYHPLKIYRHQVLKQADTVLAHFLDEDISDYETIKNSFDYYEKRTTHDSSLSSCVYGIMASRLDNMEKALKYFKESVNLDLDNTHKNTKDGLHMANLAGTAMSVVYGFAGLRIKKDCLVLRPKKPDDWTSYSFKINYKGAIIKIEISKEIDVIIENGKELEIIKSEKEIIIK